MGKKIRLKDKTWLEATIKIERVVAQFKPDVATTETKTLYYLVDIRTVGSGIGFRADSRTQLWKMIKQRLYLSKVEKIKQNP